jgi:uncharacterized protein (TIGR02217 family)
MPFLEERISTAVRRGSSGGPVARRVIHRTDSGIVGQVAVRSYPLQRYRFDFGNKTLEDAEAIRALFYVVMFGAPGGGCYDGFRVRDWNDYRLTQANSRLVAVTGGFQLCRVYTVGAAEYVRPIRKIEPGTAVIYDAGSPVAATVDNDTGIVTAGGNAAYTAEANFDIPVTFADDDALASIGLDGGVDSIIQSLGEVELEELPLGYAP